MKRNYIVFLFPLLFLSQLAFSQTTEVEGTVKDDQGNPVEKVTIVFQSATITTVKFDLKTNKRGEFYFPGLLYQGEPGSWKIFPVFEGYLVKHLKVESRDSMKQLQTSIDQNLGIRQSHPEILAKPGGKVIIDFIIAPESSFQQQVADSQQGSAAAKAVELSTLDKARALCAEGKAGESIALYRQAAAEEKSADIYLEMSRVLLEQSRVEEASAALKSALAVNPNISMLHFTLANILRKQGDYNGAIEEMKQELAVSPDAEKVNVAIGELYVEAGKDAEAEGVYKKILEKSPDNISAYMALGGIYNRMGDFARSEQAYRKVIDLNPKNADMIYYNVGVSIINKKDLTNADRTSAMDAFKKALELNPDHAGAHLQLGYILLGQGKFPEAKTHFKRYIELKPNSPEAGEVKSILQAI